MLAVASASAQPATSDPSARVLRRNVDEHLPEGPARAEEGGCRFEYQSLRGRTDDDRSCTVYCVPNTTGKPPTHGGPDVEPEALVGAEARWADLLRRSESTGCGEAAGDGP